MISLAKALKIKNRLAGKLTQLQNLVKVNNATPQGEVRSTNVKEAWEELQAVGQKLTLLKGLIGGATAPISFKLASLAENKSILAFLDTIIIREAVEERVTGYGVNSTVKQITYNNLINEAARQKYKADTQKAIEQLQDEIDEFNAVTKVDFKD